mmetsp:Transcript_46336/g.107859  ORF Transcript_46336/g.107859 Transcript_46336/m.107859 type:complete len:266 (-) Transcript_46336:472-1269(-)
MAFKSASLHSTSALCVPNSSSIAVHVDADASPEASPTVPSHANNAQCLERKRDMAEATRECWEPFGSCSHKAFVSFSNNSRAFASVGVMPASVFSRSGLLPAASTINKSAIHTLGAFFKATASRSKRRTLDPWNIAKCTVSPGPFLCSLHKLASSSSKCLPHCAPAPKIISTATAGSHCGCTESCFKSFQPRFNKGACAFEFAASKTSEHTASSCWDSTLASSWVDPTCNAARIHTSGARPLSPDKREGLATSKPQLARRLSTIA